MKRERGAALLLVVLLVSLLAVIVLEFFREAALEYRAAANLRDALAAHALARSGAAIFAVILQADAQLNPADSRKSLWMQPIPPIPVGDFVVSVDDDREDLDGRFPLGALVDNKGKAKPAVVEAYKRLLKTLELGGADPDQLADALVDWIDKDDRGTHEHNENYAVPNAALEHLEDLSRIEGYTGPVYNSVVKFVDTRAEKKLNVNTAPAEVLAALHNGIDLDTAKQVYADLEEAPYDKVDLPGLRTRLKMGTNDKFDLDPAVESSRFRIKFEVQPAGDPTKTVRRATALLVRDRQKKTVSIAEWRED